MKTIFKTMFVLMCGLVMTTALVACGSDGDDGGNNKQFTFNGEWMAAYMANGETHIDFYTLNGSSAKMVAYSIKSLNALNGTTLRTDQITNITKEMFSGSFTYDNLTLTCTFPEGKVEGFYTVRNYEEFEWAWGLTIIGMTRANNKTNALKSQLEQVYQAKNAK